MMKNAPITIKVTAGLLAAVVLIFSVLELTDWIQVRSAKKWCEEYAELMLEEPGRHTGDMSSHFDTAKKIGWEPALFYQAYGFSAGVYSGEACVDFSSSRGSYSFSSKSGWMKIGDGMPVAVSVDED